MITNISIENFKGIGEPHQELDPVEIELAPVTLLFGSNSAGKSTIFHAFLLAYEVFVNGNRNPDRTILGGKSVDLGGFATFVHKHDLERSVMLEFQIDLKSERLDLEHPIAEFLVGTGAQIDLATIGEDVWHALVRIRVSWDFDSSVPYVSEYAVALNTCELATITCGRAKRGNCQLELNPEHELFSWPDDIESDSLGVLDMLYPQVQTALERAFFAGDSVGNSLPDPDDQTIVISWGDDQPCEADEIRSVYCSSDDGREFQAFLQREANEYNGCGIEIREFRFLRRDRWKSDAEAADAAEEQARLWSTVRPRIRVHTPNDALPDWELPLEIDLLPENPTEVDEGHSDQETRAFHEVFADLVARLVVVPGRILARLLNESRYIGPLREVPLRGHKAPLSPDASRWSSGMAAWDELHRGDDAFLAITSQWLASEDKLGTGYSLIRRRFRELEVDGFIIRLLHRENPLDSLQMALEEIQKLPIQSRLMLRDEESEVEVEPQDIAIGITQLVPVVVAALDQRPGISMIEQPELHNHPSVEVGLGDLFASASGHENARFMLETHGEHLLLRMLRRIRESSEQELPEGVSPLTPEKLAVYFVERDVDGVRVMRLRVDESGEFIDKWPHGFFRERAEELF